MKNLLLNSFFDGRKTVKYMKVVERQRELQKKNDRNRFPTIEKYMRGDSSRRRYKHSTLFLETKLSQEEKSDIMRWAKIGKLEFVEVKKM